MAAFSPLLDVRVDVADPRRAQGNIALDGKTLRGSVEPKGLPDLDNLRDRAVAQVLGAFATATALVLAHRTSPKSPTRSQRRRCCWPNSASAVALSSRLTRHTAKKHRAVANIALIVQVKDNQPTLNQQPQDISASTAPLGSVHSYDKDCNRHQHRIVAVFDPANNLVKTNWHSHVAVIIRVERTIYTRNAKIGLLRSSIEIAFHLANTPVTAACAAEAIRAHQAIKNTSHGTARRHWPVPTRRLTLATTWSTGCARW